MPGSPSLYRFDGKTVVLTGSSGGIGRAAACKFGQAGARVILHANQNVAESLDLLREVEQSGGSGEVIAADFNLPTDRRLFLETVLQKTKSVDIWINAAGLDLMDPRIAECSFEEKIRRLFQVDVFATFEFSRVMVQRMKEQGHGTIFFLGWDGADFGWKGETAELYGAAKGAIQGFCRSLAERASPEVRIRCLSLGWIKTRWGKKASDDFTRRVSKDSLSERWGEPEEIADAILFLSSPASSYVDGLNIRLNGGKRGTKE